MEVNARVAGISSSGARLVHVDDPANPGAALTGPLTYLDSPGLRLHSSPGEDDDRQIEPTCSYSRSLGHATVPDSPTLDRFSWTRDLETQTPLAVTYLQGQYIKKHTLKFHVSHVKKIAF